MNKAENISEILQKEVMDNMDMPDIIFPGEFDDSTIDMAKKIGIAAKKCLNNKDYKFYQKNSKWIINKIRSKIGFIY